MKRAHVTLEVRTPDGLFRRAEYTGSGKPKKTDGTFYLRYTENRSRKRERLGTTDPNEAALLLSKREALLTAVERGIVPSLAAPISSMTKASVSVKDAAATYLELCKTKSYKTLRASSRAVNLFLDFCAAKGVTTLPISRDTMLVFKGWLMGLEEATDQFVRNNFLRVATFLNDRGYHVPLQRKDWPKVSRDPDEKYEIYDEQEMVAMLAVADADDADLILFFAGTGFRLLEVSHAQYSDINWQDSTIRVSDKPHWGFKTKDREAKWVEVSKALLDILRHRMARKGAESSDLIFPAARSGDPDRHLDRRVKALIRKANKRGYKVKTPRKPCHAFRVLFACRRAESGVPIEQIRVWLRHSDIQTTQIYLRSMQRGSDKLRTKIDQADDFGMPAVGAAAD
jgi:integrase